MSLNKADGDNSSDADNTPQLRVRPAVHTSLPLACLLALSKIDGSALPSADSAQSSICIVVSLLTSKRLCADASAAG